ncbi:hypothetical protein ACVWZK_004310 [Bradyrhizobium sp. GM0.4]
MRTARPHDHWKAQFARDLLANDPASRKLRQLRTRRGGGHGNVEAGHARQQTIQLVAIEIANEIGTIEQRLRPVRRGLLDQRERLPALLGIGCDHDGDVVLRQSIRQADALDNVERQQLDVGIFKQEVDRRVAAHVDIGGEREHAQAGFWSRARRTKQLVEGEHLGLDHQPSLLLAEKLGNQREIEAFAGLRRSLLDPRQQPLAQRIQVTSLEGAARQLRKADAVGIGRRGHAARRGNWMLHLTPRTRTLPARPQPRHDQAAARSSPAHGRCDQERAAHCAAPALYPATMPRSPIVRRRRGATRPAAHRPAAPVGPAGRRDSAGRPLAGPPRCR